MDLQIPLRRSNELSTESALKDDRRKILRRRVGVALIVVSLVVIAAAVYFIIAEKAGKHTDSADQHLKCEITTGENTQHGIAVLNSTDIEQIWRIPSGVNHLEILLWGAGGGGGASSLADNCTESNDHQKGLYNFGGSGGSGGFTRAIVDLSCVDHLFVRIGKGGVSGIKPADMCDDGTDGGDGERTTVDFVGVFEGGDLPKEGASLLPNFFNEEDAPPTKNASDDTILVTLSANGGGAGHPGHYQAFVGGRFGKGGKAIDVSLLKTIPRHPVPGALSTSPSNKTSKRPTPTATRLPTPSRTSIPVTPTSSLPPASSSPSTSSPSSSSSSLPSSSPSAPPTVSPTAAPTAAPPSPLGGSTGMNHETFFQLVTSTSGNDGIQGAHASLELLTQGGASIHYSSEATPATYSAGEGGSPAARSNLDAFQGQNGLVVLIW